MPRRVLLVDDDLAEIASVRRALAGGEHEVVLATNASDALTEVARARPDVVLLAPGCDGGEGATLARELAASGAGVPLVAIGGTDDPGALRVDRPIDGASLLAALREAAGTRPPAAPSLPPREQPPRRERELDHEPGRDHRPDPDRDPEPDPEPHLPLAPVPPGQPDLHPYRPPLDGVRTAERVASTLPGDVTALLSSADAGAAELRALLEAEASLRRASDALDAERRRELEEEERRRAAALERVAEKLAQVRRDDYFSILGIAPGATTDEVREATRRLLSELASDRLGGEVPEALLADLEEIREVVTDASEVLADPVLREEYAAALAPQGRGDAREG